MGILSDSVLKFTSLYRAHIPSISYKRDISGYVEAVKQQRARLANRDYKKWDPFIEGYTNPTRSLQTLVENHLYMNQYTYCGTKLIDVPIYEGYEDYIYSEFVSKEADFSNDYSSWKFIYVPLSYELKEGYLPTVYRWNNEASNEKPDFYYVKPLSATSWPSFYALETDNLSHPYLGSSFLFNGKVVIQGDESILYEYIETEDHYGCAGVTYMSPLRPHFLDFPAGLPQPGELERDECMSPYINEYPARGEWPYLGRFTGYTTTNKYMPIKHFLYEREDGSVFLYREEPSSEARSLIEHRYPNLFIYPTESDHVIVTKHYSEGLSLLIR